ncbi:polysaccharide deacetylase family protein [Cohnella terricola]|nr:polysaccharide deacetylase family protein [Cohnella terricola]
MRGKRASVKRAWLGAFMIVLMSAWLSGCGMLQEWNSIGLTGGAVVSGASPEPTITEETANEAEPEVQPPQESPDPVPTQPAKAHEGKLVALTFDDGPDNNYTLKILDILKENDVKATFFLVGTQVRKYPETAKRIVEEGHSVGNHSWSHSDLTKLSAKALSEQIDKAQKEIIKATGVTPSLMRAPYGAISGSVLKTVHLSGMQHVAWTVDTKDWAGSSVAAMHKNVMTNTKEGGVILMHSFGGRKNSLDHTVKLLPSIIKDLKAKGYELVTVDEMVASGHYRTSVIK